ncbi:hypothetical protein DERF_006749 [Dermatophagoides farinae]|uniref:Uncharacterized protein n=1 Tax=Dermatophagoides farinae TaxID=6954 RepID=A0A922L2E1_DERFA|nr:hypothetical protein DERF_006749 [Dermatophagoides farinae]
MTDIFSFFSHFEFVIYHQLMFICVNRMIKTKKQQQQQQQQQKRIFCSTTPLPPTTTTTIIIKNSNHQILITS